MHRHRWLGTLEFIKMLGNFKPTVFSPNMSSNDCSPILIRYWRHSAVTAMKSYMHWWGKIKQYIVLWLHLNWKKTYRPTCSPNLDHVILKLLVFIQFTLSLDRANCFLMYLQKCTTDNKSSPSMLGLRPRWCPWSAPEGLQIIRVLKPACKRSPNDLALVTLVCDCIRSTGQAGECRWQAAASKQKSSWENLVSIVLHLKVVTVKHLRNI